MSERTDLSSLTALEHILATLQVIEQQNAQMIANQQAGSALVAQLMTLLNGIQGEAKS